MISLKKLTLHQGNFSLTDIEMTIPSGEYAVLMGATGCGKTTLLEAIIGLRRISGGKVLVENQDVTHLRCSARRIGYVPQDAALFPSMRVDQQIEFGLQIRKMSRAIRKRRVEELAELLEIESLLRRYPQGLSGGEQQRVALARALSFKPRLLCLDEPLSALDDATRKRMAECLRVAHQQEQVTVLHITHSTAEADDLATVQYRMDDGRIVQTSATI